MGIEAGNHGEIMVGVVRTGNEKTKNPSLNQPVAVGTRGLGHCSFCCFGHQSQHERTQSVSLFDISKKSVYFYISIYIYIIYIYIYILNACIYIYILGTLIYVYTFLCIFERSLPIFGRAFFLDVRDPPHPRRRRQKVRKYNDNFFVVIPLLRLTEEAKRCQRNPRISCGHLIFVLMIHMIHMMFQ